MHLFLCSHALMSLGMERRKGGRFTKWHAPRRVTLPSAPHSPPRAPPLRTQVPELQHAAYQTMDNDYTALRDAMWNGGWAAPLNQCDLHLSVFTDIILNYRQFCSSPAA